MQARIYSLEVTENDKENFRLDSQENKCDWTALLVYRGSPFRGYGTTPAGAAEHAERIFANLCAYNPEHPLAVAYRQEVAEMNAHKRKHAPVGDGDGGGGDSKRLRGFVTVD